MMMKTESSDVVDDALADFAPKSPLADRSSIHQSSINKSSINKSSGDLVMLAHGLGQKARQAAWILAKSDGKIRAKALVLGAQAIRRQKENILAANQQDLAIVQKDRKPAAFIDRLTLDGQRISAIADALDEIARFGNPVGQKLAEWRRPNGLQITKISTPIGVIAMIYESRPNVTIDAGGLCLLSANAVILRGGKECFNTAQALHLCLQEGLHATNLPLDAIQLVPVRDRAMVGLLLGGLDGAIDLIIPRGGKDLVARVQREAKAPVLAHLEGICHIYLGQSGDLAKAQRIIVNAKLRRPGICSAAECLLIDQRVTSDICRKILTALLDQGCEVRGDQKIAALDPRIRLAVFDDWGREYLDRIIAVKMVADLAAAIEHIRQYGSGHSEAIISEDKAEAEQFLTQVDSAIVFHNASTQFSDGGEFGMGAEIGIATGKLHARGPVGCAQLTSYKYVVYGDGQIRA